MMQKPDKEKPKRRPRKMRADLATIADKAHERMGKRPFVPDIERTRADWRAPYSNAKDQDRWWSMFFDMLGTRQAAVVDMFFNQLVALCGSSWSEEWNEHVANEGELRACFGLIQSMKPKTVAQAALSAQLVALHIHQMRLADGIRSYSMSDPRTAATMARLTRAFSDGLLALQKLQGKVRKTKQVISVETHHHHHQHIHYEQQGGSPQNGERADATTGGATVECAPLSGPDQARAVLPIASRKGQARVQAPRRRKGQRGQERDG